MTKVTIEWLRSLPVFYEVPCKQLQWLINNSAEQIYEAGTFLSKPGDAANHTFVVLEGRLRVYYVQNEEAREVGIFEKGTISGYLPFSKGKISSVYLEAISPLKVLALPIQDLPNLISQHYELTYALVGVMLNRVRTFTALQRKNEKVMALGKLSSGLAHELDPLSNTVLSSSRNLKTQLHLMPETFQKLVKINMEAGMLLSVNKKIKEIMNRNIRPEAGPEYANPLRASLTGWMEEHHINCSAETINNLTDFGFSVTDANELGQFIPDNLIAAAFNWINTSLLTESMLKDIGDSSGQIAQLVGAVKNFTHMDRGHAKQYANIHDGIFNTLIMLRHKISKGSITVKQNFDLTLPPVRAMIGELNQVWTNLIDNALDAMEHTQDAVLEIITMRDNDDVLISIIDNGAGIPDDLIYKIFDPFFTTKPIGRGSGLGLDLVKRIVTQHHGTIRVKSIPGNTEFTVCFPING